MLPTWSALVQQAEVALAASGSAAAPGASGGDNASGASDAAVGADAAVAPGLDRSRWLEFILAVADQAALEAIPKPKVADEEWEAICSDELPAVDALDSSASASTARVNAQWVASGLTAEALWDFIDPSESIPRAALAEELQGFGLSESDAAAFAAQLPASAASAVERAAFDAAFAASTAAPAAEAVGTSTGSSALLLIDPQWVASGVTSDGLWDFIAPVDGAIPRGDVEEELQGFGLSESDTAAFVAHLPPSAEGGVVDRAAFDAAFGACTDGGSAAGGGAAPTTAASAARTIDLAPLSPADAVELERFARDVGAAPTLEGFQRDEWAPLFRAYADWVTGVPGFGGVGGVLAAENAAAIAAAAAFAALPLPPMPAPPPGPAAHSHTQLPALPGMPPMPMPAMPMPAMPVPNGAMSGGGTVQPRAASSAAASMLSGIAGFNLKALKKAKKKKKKKKKDKTDAAKGGGGLPERVDETAARAACTRAGLAWDTETQLTFRGAAEADGTVARGVVAAFLAARRPTSRKVMSPTEVARRCRGLVVGGGNAGGHRTTEGGGDAESKEAWFDEDWGTFDDDSAVGKDCPALVGLDLVNVPRAEASAAEAALYARSSTLAARSAVDATAGRAAKAPLVAFVWASYQSARLDVAQALRTMEALYRCERCCVRVLGVSTDASRAALARARLSCTFPVAFDAKREVRTALMALADQASLHTPQVFVFDGATGRCVWRESLLQHHTLEDSQLLRQLGRAYCARLSANDCQGARRSLALARLPSALSPQTTSPARPCAPTATTPMCTVALIATTAARQRPQSSMGSATEIGSAARRDGCSHVSSCNDSSILITV